MSVSEASRWNRHGYPLQTATKGSIPQRLTTPRAEAEEKLPSDQLSATAESTRTNGLCPAHEEVDQEQGIAESPRSRNPLTPPPEVEDKNPGVIRQERSGRPSQNHHSEAMWSRGSYPLQSPTKGSATLQQPPPHFEEDGRAAPAPAPAPAPVIAPAPAPSPAQPSQMKKATANTSSWSRQGYPLQSSTWGAPAQPQARAKTSSGAPSDQQSEPPSHHLQEHKEDESAGNVWHRQVYPAQSSSNGSTPVHPPTSPRSEKPSEGSDEQTPARIHESGNATDKTSAWHRQVYPLQSSTKASTLHRSAQSETEAPKLNKPAPMNLKEARLATNVIKQWQRQVYPVQSPTSGPGSDHASMPPLYEEPEAKAKPRPSHLPKNIRAARDAEKIGRKGRTIVVCLDGTGDKFDSDNSNIVHLVSCLKKDDPSQVTYYQAGIGTYSSGGLSSGASAALDMAVGSGLGLHVRDAYHFLMHTYKEGDKICIFGFSRGAYTARCVAGMVHKVGLLPPRNVQQIPFAYEFYANDTPAGWRQSDEFKKTFSIEVNVYFLGVFDSVASVGFIPRQLPLSSTPTCKPRHFRHAMALDERRSKFKVCRHKNADHNSILASEGYGSLVGRLTQFMTKHVLPNYKEQDDHPPPYSQRLDDGDQEYLNDKTDDEYERLTGHERPFDTDVHEVWFMGAHADVGGGAVKDVIRHKVSHIPLRWMIRQAFECNTGIIFKTKVLAEHGLDVHTLWPTYEKLTAPLHEPSPSILEKYEQLPPRSVRRSKLVPINKHENGEDFYHLKIFEDGQTKTVEDWTPEHVEDFFDAMSPLNDQLIQAPNWWILEFWPVEYKLPIGPESSGFYTKVGMNLGRYRYVEDVEPNLHWTVLHRMRHKGYKINARHSAHAVWRPTI